LVSTTRPTLGDRDSIYETARRSRRAVNAPLEAGTREQEKSTISCKAGRDRVLFFRKAHKPGWRLLLATRDQDFGVRRRERLVTAQAQLRNGAERPDLILRREEKLHVSKMVKLVASFAPPGTVLRGPCLRQRAPQDEAGGRKLPTLRAGLAVTLTREWRRKPLKSLKTDSEMASRRLMVVGKEIRMPMTQGRGGARDDTDQAPAGSAKRCAAT
jgi:hypothetical protein